MKIYHATDKKNLPGIERGGLRADMASGKMPAVWGVHRDAMDDAVLHAANKRRVAIKDIVILELTVPDSWVKRFSRPGYFYVKRDVCPERIRVYGRLSLVRAK